jgi:hypothetical protein
MTFDEVLPLMRGRRRRYFRRNHWPKDVVIFRIANKMLDGLFMDEGVFLYTNIDPMCPYSFTQYDVFAENWEEVKKPKGMVKSK